MASSWMLARKLSAVHLRHPQPLTVLQRHALLRESSLSTTTNTKQSKKDDAAATVTTTAADAVHAQPFVQTRIKAGEWDPARTDPLYRPKYKSRSKIISADDFNARPTVGLEETSEFDSFQDAMVTLSWLDQGDHQQIYQLYCDLISHADSKHGKTSHEYVMRVIAQKYNITPGRVAGVVQLQHNEEQIKRNDPDRVLLTKAADYMDSAIKKEIAEAYQTFGLKKPDDFVEDPVGVSAKKESSQWQVVEDVFDVDQIMEDTIVREEREARLAIDGHVYIEDVDDQSIKIPMSKDARQLLKAKERMKDDKKQESVVDWPVNKFKPRPRWKFIAQTVNTRKLKKERAWSKGYTNNSPVNTLVEHDGELRAATMADIKLTSWKPVRHVQEHTYSSAKQGWLDRSVRSDETAWGMAPPMRERPPPAKSSDESSEGIAAKDAAGEGIDAKDAAQSDEEKKAAADSGSSSDDSDSSSDEEGGVANESSDEDSSEDEDAKEDAPVKEDEDLDDKKK
jgi:hypothetical protein